ATSLPSADDDCESGAAPGGCCCNAPTESAGGISAVPGAVASMLSRGVGTMFDGAAAVELAAADAAAVFQVSEAVVSAPDWALANALANRTSSIAASDAPSA